MLGLLTATYWLKFYNYDLPVGSFFVIFVIFFDFFINNLLLIGLKYNLNVINICNYFILILKIAAISINFSDVLYLDKNLYFYCVWFLGN